MHSSSSTIQAMFAAALVAVSAAARLDDALPHARQHPVRNRAAAGRVARQPVLGQAVTNQAGETIGDVNDVLFDKTGRISTVVIGIGGFLGIGESVAVPFATLSFTADANGKRVVMVPLSRERLQAREFKATEKSMYMRAKETATEYGQKAIDKARELGDKAGKKIEEMRK